MQVRRFLKKQNKTKNPRHKSELLGINNMLEKMKDSVDLLEAKLDIIFWKLDKTKDRQMESREKRHGD
jgi:hypothetical protein